MRRWRCLDPAHVHAATGARVKIERNGQATLWPRPLLEVDRKGEIVPWIVAEGRRLARLGPGGPSFFHVDALGSTRLVTDKTGRVIGEHDYGVWGEDARTSNATASPYRYAGARSDGPGALAHMNAREYDPGLGRFVSADVIVPDVHAPQSLNRYTYVLNDPVSATDRSGYEVDCVPDPSGWGVNCREPLRQPVTPRFDEPPPQSARREAPPSREPPDLYGEQLRQYARALNFCGICHAYDPNNPSLRPVTPTDRKMAGLGLLAATAPAGLYASTEIAGSEALLVGSIIVYRAAPTLWNVMLTIGGAVVGVPSAGRRPLRAPTRRCKRSLRSRARCCRTRACSRS